MIRFLWFASIGCLFVSSAFAQDGPPYAATGVMVGEVTENTAIIQVRLSKTKKLVDRDLPGAPGWVEFRVAPMHRCSDDPPINNYDPGVGRTYIDKASAENDFIVRMKIPDSYLEPGVKYECKTRIGATRETLREGPTATFCTLPGKKQAKPVRFVVVTGMNYAKFHGDDRIDRKQHLVENNTELPKPYEGPDKHLGYPGLASILKKKPHFFVGTGDNVYYDTPDKPRAETIAELRQKWHEQFMQPRYRDLFAAVPTYWMVDDHDYRIDDGDNSGDYKPTPQEAQRMMYEQLPYAATGDRETKTYRTHRVSRDLQVWFTENRIYRSDNADPDGPKKTIWGAEQKAWLMKTLQESDAAFKLLISPTPMVGPDDARKFDNHTNINGFRHERDEFFKWLQESGLLKKHFYVLCGDRHWQYHSRHPSGVEEFSCGALVDANSRLGRKPGDPKSTDPKGLIKQIYAQKKRSGGFLMVDVDPAQEEKPAALKFTWCDELGKVLHRHEKTARDVR